LCLTPSNDGERRAFVRPDLIIRFSRPSRPGAEDDSVEDRFPGDCWNFHHPRIAEKLGEVPPHSTRMRRVRRAEVDEQDADLRIRRSGHATDMGSNGSERILLPVAANIA